MNHTEKNHEPASDAVGLSADDLSMLNQVLQQVKGSSCVSCDAFDITEPVTES